MVDNKVIRSVIMVTLISFSASVSFAGNISDGRGENLTEAEFLSVVDGGNKYALLNTLNDMKGNKLSNDVKKILIGLWRDGKVKAHSNIVIADDLIQTASAGVLLQNYFFFGGGEEADEIAAFLRRKISSKDAGVSIEAISSLMVIGSDSDADAFYNAALLDNARFRMAVVAIASMCSKHADQLLDKLYESSPKDNKDFITEQKNSNGRKAHCLGRKI